MMIKLLGCALIGLLILLIVNIYRLLVSMQKEIDFLEEVAEKITTHMVALNENLLFVNSRLSPNEFKEALNKLTPEQLKAFEELLSRQKNKHH